MKGVTKAAKLASLRSQKCGICPIRQRCDPAMLRACHDAFVEAIKKAEDMRKQKIASLKKQVDKLEKLKFEL